MNWTPFQRATLPPVTPEMIDAVAASMPMVPREEIEKTYADLDNDAVFLPLALRRGAPVNQADR
jgi:hypothetical protein